MSRYIVYRCKRLLIFEDNSDKSWDLKITGRGVKESKDQKKEEKDCTSELKKEENEEDEKKG